MQSTAKSLRIDGCCFSQYLILRFRVDVPDSLASFSETAKATDN